jgi:hypothetical protein
MKLGIYYPQTDSFVVDMVILLSETISPPTKVPDS